MSEGDTTDTAARAAEQRLREELAQGDRALAAARPLLRQVLAAEDPALIDDEVVAHVQGALLDVARQLLEAQAEAAGDAGAQRGFAGGRTGAIAATLFDDGAFLAHVHALAIEAQVAERLSWSGDIDPVLPPLVQDCAGDDDGARAGLAMAVLAAQARFLRYYRRMELPLRDLPGDLFHRALLALRAHPGDHDGAAEVAERNLRARYDEADGRLALIARLLAGLEDRARYALGVERAGVSIFASALALASGQDRDLALLTLRSCQAARLALALRAAGLDQAAAVAQFAQLQPEALVPEHFQALSPEQAAALLSPAAPRGTM